MGKMAPRTKKAIRRNVRSSNGKIGLHNMKNYFSKKSDEMAYRPLEYWEKRADSFLMKEVLRMPRTIIYSIILKRVLRPEITTIQPTSILEVGCGPGRLLKVYQDVGKIYCVDFSEKMLERAESKARKSGITNAHFGRMACQDLKYEDDFIDLVMTSNVLLHIPPEDIEKAVSELTRVSREYVLIIEFFQENGSGGKKVRTAPWVFHHNYLDIFNKQCFS